VPPRLARLTPIVVVLLLGSLAAGGYLLLRNQEGAPHEWPVHGGDPGHRQYSPLTQIDRSNVGRLEVA
jgi:glucose dehydrogenase